MSYAIRIEGWFGYGFAFAHRSQIQKRCILFCQIPLLDSAWVARIKLSG